MVIAAKFGTTWITDAYKMAMVIPITFSIEAGIITSAITIPTFYELREKKGEAEVFNVAFNSFFLLGLAVTVIAYFASPLLIEIIAGGFAPETKTLAIGLLRIAVFVVFLNIISTFLGNILNAYRNFALPASQRIWMYGFVICAIFLLYNSLGIVSAIVGYLVGLVVFILAQFRGLVKKGMRYRLTFTLRHPVVKALVVLASPLILYSLLNQVNVFIEKRIISDFEAGKLTALDIAFKMSAFFINFAIIGINTVLYPTLSESYLAEQNERIEELFHKLLKAITVFIVPLSIAFILLQAPIVSILFERGAFNQHSTSITATALMYYGLGLLGLAMTNTFPRFYQAFKKNKVLLKIGAVAIVINILLILTLPRFFGYVGVPIAISLTATIHMAIYLVQIRRYIRVDYLDLARNFGKVLLAGTVLGITIVIVRLLVDHLALPSEMLGKVSEIVLSVLLGGIAYLASCLAARVDIVTELFSKFKKSLQGGV
jgi:putative peptidoglycan lipid II flippase